MTFHIFCDTYEDERNQSFPCSSNSTQYDVILLLKKNNMNLFFDVSLAALEMVDIKKPHNSLSMNLLFMKLVLFQKIYKNSTTYTKSHPNWINYPIYGAFPMLQKSK